MTTLYDRLLGIVRIAKIKLVVDDSGEQQRVQLALSIGAPDGVAETIDNVIRLSEYGFWSAPPIDAECVVLFMGGRRSNPVVIATGDLATRPKGLEPGEALFGNPGQNATIKATKDGTFDSVASDWTHDGDIHQTGTFFATHVKPDDGATGSFTTEDGKTVTVTNGIITDIS